MLLDHFNIIIDEYSYVHVSFEHRHSAVSQCIVPERFTGIDYWVERLMLQECKQRVSVYNRLPHSACSSITYVFDPNVQAYDIERHQFKLLYHKTSHNILHFGPIKQSASGAVEICDIHRGTLWVVNSLDHWYTIVRSIEAVEGSHPLRLRIYLPWIVHVDYSFGSLYSNLEERNIICRNIDRLASLMYMRYTIMDHTGTHSHTFSRDIIQNNKNFFCTDIAWESYFDSIPKTYMHKGHPCAVIIGNDMCNSITLVFVPCNETFASVNFVCDFVNVTHKTTYSYNQLDTSKLAQQTAALLQNNSFLCIDQTFLLYHHVCDGIADCPDGRDEENCSHVCHFMTETGSSQNDCYLQCHRSNCSCEPLYFQCEERGCVPSTKICDCYNDCPDGSDEVQHLCSIYLKDCTEISLSDHLLSWEDTTTLQWDYFLPNAKDLNICSDKLSARRYIQLYHLCDGTRDCLYDEDEWAEHCNNFTAVHSLRCPRDKRFVSSTHINNDISECPTSHDDELLVNLNSTMPPFCASTGLSIMCKNPIIMPMFDKATRYMFLIEVGSIDILNESLSLLTHLLILIITDSNITSLYKNIFSTFNYMTKVLLSNSSIVTIEQFAFHNLSNLFQLDLSWKPFPNLHNDTFTPLTNLTHL